MALDFPGYVEFAKPALITPERTYTPAPTINKQGKQIQQATAGEGAPIPEVYGTARVAARVATATVYNGYLYLLCVWCGGPVSSIVRVLQGDQDVPAGNRHDYTGTPSQTADAWLSAAISGYADALTGICYSVIRYASADGFAPRLIAEIAGRNDVYDPRGPSTGYSDNPALCLAHLIDTHTTSTLDWTSVETCADACDELVTGQKRRLMGLALEQPSDIQSIVGLMREYAGCFVQWSEPVVMVPNRPRATDHALAAANIRRIEIRKRGMDQLPNRVTVRYTDTSATEWRQAQVTVSDIVSGAEVREQVITLPGIQRYGQASRQAIERLNYYRLADLEATLEVFDEGLEVTAGDVASVTHPLGLTDKLMRVLSAEAIEPGRWRLGCDEYSAGVYSDDVSSKSAFADTELPAPGTPAAPSGLVLTEVNYRLRDGRYVSRLRAAWTASTDPYLSHHRVVVTTAGASVFAADVRGDEIDTGALEELLTYTVSITAVSPFGESAAVSDSLALVGKYAVPTGAGMVLSGLEVGGEVRLSWTPDTSDYDIQRYEVRYGATGGSWSTATLLDQTDSLTLVTKNIPPGTWRFYVKSIDSVRQYSSGQSYKDITVTLDDRAYLVGSHAEATASTTYLHATVETRGGPAVYYSDGNDTWNSLFASAMSTYTSALLGYQSAQGTSEWLGDEWDVTGADVTGDWLAELTVQDLSGTATQQLGLKPNAGAYTYGDLSQKASARYARARVQSAGLFKLTMAPTIGLNAVTREERGQDTSSASGGKTITLAGVFQAAQSITVTPIFDGSPVACIPVVDAVTTGDPTSFDVYIFDAASPTSKLAVDFKYSFVGV